MKKRKVHMKAELIKQAYAYGAAVALQELGFGARDAEAGGVKLAMAKMAEGEEEEEGMHPALRALIGGSAGAVGGAALGAGSAFIPGLRGPALARGVQKGLGGVENALLGARGRLSSRGLSGGRMENALRSAGSGVSGIEDALTGASSRLRDLLPGRAHPMTDYEAMLRGGAGASLGALGGSLAGGLTGGE